MLFISILFPFWVHGSLDARIPIFINNNGIPRIKIQPTFFDGAVGEVGYYMLALELRVTLIGNANEHVTSLSFVSGHDDTIVATGRTAATASLLGRNISIFGMSPESLIYNDFPNGFLLIQDSPFEGGHSMIINPQNDVETSFCMHGSLFYIPIFTDSFLVAIETLVIPPINHQQPIIPQSEPDMGYFSLSASGTMDSLPHNVVNELLEYIIPDSIEQNVLPLVVHNCDFSRYPSIEFRFGEYTSVDHFQHIGSVIYGPDDYMEYVSETSCSFKIRKSQLGSFAMNFFSKIAVHLRSDRVGFCDPSA